MSTVQSSQFSVCRFCTVSMYPASWTILKVILMTNFHLESTSPTLTRKGYRVQLQIWYLNHIRSAGVYYSPALQFRCFAFLKLSFNASIKNGIYSINTRQEKSLMPCPCIRLYSIVSSLLFPCFSMHGSECSLFYTCPSRFLSPPPSN